MKARILLFSTGILFLAGFTSVGSAQERAYPNREIKVIVGHGAGGGVDLHFRLLFKEMETTLKVPVIIVNQAGGSSIVAASEVAAAKKDGYTLLGLLVANLVIKNIVDPKGPVDLIRDFDPVFANPGSNTNVLITRSDSEFKSLKDLVDYARKKPGVLSIGTGTVGSNVHLELLMFQRSAKINIGILPFSATPETIQMVLGGHVNFGEIGDTAVIPHLASGKVKVLAAVGKRSRVAPDVPTYAEQGYPNVDLEVCPTLLGPKGIPGDVTKVWENALSLALKNANFLASFKKVGINANFITGADKLRNLFKKDFERYSRFSREDLGQ